MNILVIGQGAREHATIWKCAQSDLTDILYCFPGNGGISAIAKCVDYDINDFDGIVEFAKDKKIDLIIVGPEEPLANGIADRCKSEGFLILGPSMLGACIESSKYFCHLLLGSWGIQTAPYRAFTLPKLAKKYIRNNYFGLDKKISCVVKADELMAGKGAIVPDTLDEALSAADYLFGECKSKLILVEDRIEGTEYSFTVITDGIRVIPFVVARDYKRERDGDLGPNTGGQGCFAPALSFEHPLFKKMQKIAERVVFALRAEFIEYRGFLYFNFMVDKNGNPYVLEINVRLGDPEAQVILPLMESDFVELCLNAAKGDLRNTEIRWKNEARVCIVISSPRSGYRIYGLKWASEEGAIVFHARSFKDELGNFYTSGQGRTLSVVGKGVTVSEARKNAYNASGKISFWRKDPNKGKQYYRRDIALNVVS